MRNFLYLLAGGLAFPTTLGQIVNYAVDGGFESVPKKSTDKQDASAGSWAFQDDAVFAYNPTQPKGYTTPYGSKFVYYANTAKSDTGGAVEQLVAAPENTNFTVRYSYTVFQNKNPKCQMVVVFDDAVVDSFILPQGKSAWTERATPSFRSANISNMALYGFMLQCKQTTIFKPWNFGLDNVELLYDGCPACG